MHVEGLLPADLCLLTLLISEQCSQFERFFPQHVQMVNKTSSFKTKLLGNYSEAGKVNHVGQLNIKLYYYPLMFDVLDSRVSLQSIALPNLGR